jgi:hypothetical protein
MSLAAARLRSSLCSGDNMRMNLIVFVSFLCVASALLAWAFSTHGKEGMLIFFLGAALLLCTLAVGGTRLVTGKTSTTNKFGILGATIGLFSGAVVGVKIGFGRVMISIFNPDLPERDFVTSFGAIGGGILGAFFLALLSGILQMLFVRPEKAAPVEDSEASDSRGDTA